MRIHAVSRSSLLELISLSKTSCFGPLPDERASVFELTASILLTHTLNLLLVIYFVQGLRFLDGLRQKGALTKPSPHQSPSALLSAH